MHGETDFDAFCRLYEKVRHIQDRPSVRTVRRGEELLLTHGLRRDHTILVANEKGQGAIASDDKGRHFIIIDNVRYTPDEFFQLLADYDEDDLHWEIRPYTQPLGDEESPSA